MTLNRDLMSISGHGAPEPVPLEALTADDPDLYLATADMDAWHDAHPCTCTGGLCECGE